MKTAIVVFAHGSRIESANESVREVARRAAAAGGFQAVETAFLDCTSPTLADSVGALAARGVERILVVPYFLTLGTHLQRDLPELVAAAARAHPGVKIRSTPPLEGHPALAGIVVQLASEALAGW